MNCARAANKYFNDSEPWKTAREDPDRCATTISISLQICRALAILMAPVVPATSRKLWTMLNLDGNVHEQRWDDCARRQLDEGHALGTAGILINKIEDSVIEEELSRLPRTEPVQPAAPPPAPAKPTITIDDFAKVDLRVGKVVGCEAVPKSSKLLKLQVEVGGEQRQIVAGIAQHYKPEDITGKSIVVVFNLQPAKLMGQESQGMLLAASDARGNLLFIAPSGEIASGSVVK
jgi:methionyl-tRNA synthetase